jgi:hypothetical protein
LDFETVVIAIFVVSMLAVAFVAQTEMEARGRCLAVQSADVCTYAMR